MTMTEQTPEAPKKAPAKKRHARRNKRAASAPAPVAAKPKPASALAGLTITDCATGCYESGKCVISGSVCAHPGKGGLQAALQSPESLQRFNEAKRIIGQNKLDLQNQ